MWSDNKDGLLPCSGLPWFHKTLDYSPTIDYIEMRICGNEESSVAYYEIYAK